MVKSIFNSDQISFIMSNAETMTYRDMSNLPMFSGYTEKQLRSKGRGLGIIKKRQFNDRYFQNIDTDNKAYWVGFIYADGAVCKSHEMRIGIHVDDRYILENLNEALGNQHIIKDREREIEFNGYKYISRCSEFRVFSKPLCQDLISIGVVENKAHSEIHPKFDGKLFYSFLRGFFDGDGSVSSTERSGAQVTITNSNNIILNYIKEKLELDEIKSTIYKEQENKYKLFISRYSHKDFFKKLYQTEGIKLNRKYDIAITL